MAIFDFIKSAAGFATNIVDKIWPDKLDETERSAAVLELQKMIEARDDTLIKAQRDIIVAELEQGDKFTKRARPMIVYVGLGSVVFNYVLVPFVNRIAEWIALAKGASLDAFGGLSPLDLPADFWYVWGGVCAVYAVGRTAEKRGVRNQIVGWITGNKNLHANGG
jgi:hypothetical protein